MVEPWSDRRQDLLYAGLVAHIVNYSWRAPKQPAELSKFVPDWWGAAEKVLGDVVHQAPGQMEIFVGEDEEKEAHVREAERLLVKIEALNKAFGGRVVDLRENKKPT